MITMSCGISLKDQIISELSIMMSKLTISTTQNISMVIMIMLSTTMMLTMIMEITMTIIMMGTALTMDTIHGTMM